MKIGFVIVFLWFFSEGFAQKKVNNHTVFWHKTEINEIFSNGNEDKPKGWGLGADFVFRSKSTFENPSPFTEINRIGFRPWFHYQFSPNARLSLSPIGFKYTNEYKARPEDYERKPYEERRITLQFFHHKKEEGGRFMHTWRYRYEWRWQETASGDWRYFNRLRVRYRLRYMISGNDFYQNKIFYAAVNNEIGINIGRNVSYMFNQNRFYAALGYRFWNAMRTELRYVNRYRARGAIGNEYDQAQGFMLMFYIDQLSKISTKDTRSVKFFD
jgi:hypothetical protein